MVVKIAGQGSSKKITLLSREANLGRDSGVGYGRSLRVRQSDGKRMARPFLLCFSHPIKAKYFSSSRRICA